MNLIKIVALMVVASGCMLGHANAAKDELMLPEQSARPLTVNQQVASIAVPSEEVVDTITEFAAFQMGQRNKIIQDDSRIMPGQEHYRNNVLYYMNVRRNWYVVSHRYKEDSYARIALDRLFADYEKFFSNNINISEMNQLEYKQRILDILTENVETINNDELRFYMNEMVIYSLQQVMKDGNNRVIVLN